MDPVQPIPNRFIEGNFLQELPRDVLGEISSYLAKKHLGNLASVCKSYNSLELSEVMWKNLKDEPLPEAYQNKVGLILKEKFKSYHDFFKNKVNLVLNNNDLKISSAFSESLLFPEELIAQLNDSELSLKEKYAAIKSNEKLVEHLHCEFHNNVEFPRIVGDNKKVFDLLLELVDVNLLRSGRGYPLLVKAIAHKNIEIAKQLIDAGANLEGPEECKQNVRFYGQSRGFNSMSFSKEIYDEIVEYVAQKQAGVDHA